MISGIGYLIIEIIALIGCLWARSPLKKAIMILLWAPIVVFGSLMMFVAGISFATMLIGLLLELCGLDITPYSYYIAMILGFCVVGSLV